MRHLHDDARALLSTWHPSDAMQEALRIEFLDFLADYPDATSRGCLVGHLTASAMVMNADRSEVLLTFHPKVRRWLQLGGHMECEDTSVVEAARREVIEEGGIAPYWCSAYPVRLDRHPVPCGGRMSEHLDLQFLAIVDAATPPAMSDESLDLRWFSVHALPQDADESVRALIRDAQVMSIG